jgi:dGTPase
MDDAIRGGILTEDEIPAEISDVVGTTGHEWLDTFIHDIVENSYGRDDICMSEPVEKAMLDLRSFMFSRVYTNPVAKGEEGKAVELVKTLYEYYYKHEDLFPRYMLRRLDEGDPWEKVVCDYVSSMTDRFAIARYEDLFIPKSGSVY